MADSTEAHRFKSKKNSDIVLVPQPTDDPNDPLSWPAWKKAVATVSILCFGGMGSWIIGGISPALVIIGNEFDQDLEDTVRALINWSVLLLGVGVVSHGAQPLILSVDFFLDTVRFVFRHSSGVPRRVFLAVCHSNLVCRCQKFQQLYCCTYYMCLCCQLW